MGFRKEIRKFMRDIQLDMTKKNTVVQEQARMIIVLREQNTDLLNRLMARDYPELQSWARPEYNKEDEVTMDFEHDETFAGEVVDPDRVEEAE